MKSKISTISLSFICAAILVFGLTCNSVEAAGKPIVLKFAHHAGPGMPFYKNGIAPLLQELEDKSNGRIKIEYYHAGSLLKAQDMWDGTVDGITDLSWTVFSYSRLFPITSDLCGLPYSYPDATTGGLAILKLYQEGLLDKELSYAKILGFAPSNPAKILSKRPIQTPEDIKGMSFRAAGELHIKIANALGATPVALTIGDTYVSLERGVIDGVISAYGPDFGVKLDEVAKYATPLQLGGLATGLVMNKDKYERLPKDLQALVDEVLGGEASTRFMTKADDDFEEFAAKTMAEKNGVTFATLSKSDDLAYQKLLQPLWVEWIAQMEKNKVPAQKIVKRWSEVTSELGYSVPVAPFK